MMDRFSQILYDLGLEIQTSLYVDRNGVCQLNFRDRLSLQLQYLEPKEQLLIAAFIGEVSAGKYREKLLSACLVHNANHGRVGTFGYSERNNQLTYFSLIPAACLTGQGLFATMEAFVASGLQWKEAMERGKPLPISSGPSKEPGGLFGLRL